MPISLATRMNNLIGGVENKITTEKNKAVTGVKGTVARVKKNMAEDQEGLKTGKVGRNQYTNPFRK